MATYAQVVAAMASAIDTACDVESVHETPPPMIPTNSAIIVPAATWGSAEGVPFTEVDVNWEIILVAPNADYVSAFTWFFDRLTELWPAFNADKTLGGLVDGCIPMSFRQPEIVRLGAQNADIGIAVYVQLAPMRLNS